MPRLDTFQLVLQTGESGPGAVPKYSINGFPLEFDDYEGAPVPVKPCRRSLIPRVSPIRLF